MRKIGKTRKGFTLVEMVLVIAIIVILASILLFSVGKYLSATNAAVESVSQQCWTFMCLPWDIWVRGFLTSKNV